MRNAETDCDQQHKIFLSRLELLFTYLFIQLFTECPVTPTPSA